MDEFLPGFRFYPTEEELVSFYLHHQLEGSRGELHQVVPVVDIYNVEPTNLPKLAGERCRGDTEQWFFFVPRQEREAKGGRPSRTTESGYWKATGSPDYVYSSDSRVIGIKKSMVFYKGRALTSMKLCNKFSQHSSSVSKVSSSYCPPFTPGRKLVTGGSMYATKNLSWLPCLSIWQRILDLANLG